VRDRKDRDPAEPSRHPLHHRSHFGWAALLLVATGYLVSFMIRRDHAAPRVKSIAVLPSRTFPATSRRIIRGRHDGGIATELSKTGLPVIAPASVRSLVRVAPLEEVGRQLR